MACLTAIDAGDALNAFVHKTPEIALEQARAADARLAGATAPRWASRTCSAPRACPPQAASNILEGFKPEYESTVTQNLWAPAR
jgi:aspartyl-tRNA(Asn)/glutamyl-tRNA(Gln) amidotransferase subunit A